MHYIKQFSSLGLEDVVSVGGKNASLGYLLQHLKDAGVHVPDGFAVTVQAYRDHLATSGVGDVVTKALKKIERGTEFSRVKKVGEEIRNAIEKAPLSPLLVQEITQAYKELSRVVGVANCVVVVRSSATAEDLPEASFAGQQESYLNVSGVEQLLLAYKKCLASLFTDRAIMYRFEKDFDSETVGISVGVQLMVRSDKGSSGVMFTLDTESGFKDTVVISSSYGMGETVVKGEVVPDEFHVFKPMIHKALDPIIKRECGTKKIERVCPAKATGTVIRTVAAARAQKFSLSDSQIIALAHIACAIEKKYSQITGAWAPMDIEWALDGQTGVLYVVQARLETVHSHKKMSHNVETYAIAPHQKKQIVVKGQSIGQKIAFGKARIIESMHDGLTDLEEGEILVTRMTDPDWLPVMKKASAIITESGGRTCHAAIVARELGIPALVGAFGALKEIKNGQNITLDCSMGSEGFVYNDILAVEKRTVALATIPKLSIKLLVNIASPERAYQHSFLPTDGVGLARLEFIISNAVQAHPMALVHPEKIQDKKMSKKLQELTAAYQSPSDFFIKKVAEGVGMIAAAFFPRPVLVRFSDFKTNEYRSLLGGSLFEPIEENPMMGLRGASRYYHELYAPAFELECQAIKYVREAMGLHNVNVMIPFVRTVEEAECVTGLLKKQGLVSGRAGLEIFMMCEIPSNVLLIEQFAEYFDGFSIGSNDLTQTTLSVDRDSGLLAPLFDERNKAVMKMMSLAIHGSHFAGKPIGICGQAPSDHHEVAQFLMEEGIDSISLNPDTVLSFLSTFGKTPTETPTTHLKSPLDLIIPAQIA